MTEQDQSRNGTQPTSRALTTTARARPAVGPGAKPADAAFVTQLLACAQALPAYRRNRRAEPSIAAQRYRAALALI